MKNELYFSLGLHNHQPIGNFDFVIERAYRLSYKPLIEFFIKNPNFKFSLHFSGFLLEWLENNHPEYFNNLKILSEREQVEFFTGGFYEPILPIIPDKDKILQIKKLTNYIFKNFGQKPKGLWLAERVWEPHLVKPLVEAGVEYVVVDDAHFLSTGISQEDLFGYYIMEEQGYMIKVFPINMKLRYLVPFHDPNETIDYLSNLNLSYKFPIAVLFDDGEKFGLWPDTYKTVYEENWLDRFWQSLKENSSWIKIINFNEYIKKYPPLGRVYLPTASYREMMEWVLYPKAQEILMELTEKIKNEGNWDKYSPFIKGGFWRNFLTKYDEANHIHKRMLYVRNKIEKDRKNKYRTIALKEILQAQANDAYWHGIFGGLYLPHLRSNVYSHIIKAENYIERKRRKIRINLIDFDCDGRDEIIIETRHFNIYFAPHLGGGLLEWDFREKHFNLTNILTRRREAYHSKLLTLKDEEGIGKTIHERWMVKEKGLESLLFYDNHRKVSFKEYFLKKMPLLEEFLQSKENSFLTSLDFSFIYKTKDFIPYFSLSFIGEREDLKFRKIFNIYKKERRLDVIYEIENNSIDEKNFFFAWEVSFNFLAPEHEDYYFYIPNSPWKSYLKSMGIEEVNNWGLKSPILTLRCELNEKIKWLRYPIETVSLSEEGFERVYQGSSLIHLYEISLNPKNIKKIRVSFYID
jgi:alpha-amylase